MALAYKRINEEQDKLRGAFPKGEYPFHIKSIEEKLCSNEINTMLVVDLVVINDSGRQLTIRDWVMLDMENWEWKLRHFAATCGLLDRYDKGLLEASDFLGKNGVAKLTIAEYEKDGEVAFINRVSDYIKPGQAKGNDFIDDDIPL